MKKIGFVILLFSFILTFSCKKENEKPFITIIPENILIETFANEKLVFYINVYSDVVLKKFIVTKKFAGEAEIVLLDSNLYVKDFSFEWAFYTPTDIKEDLLLYFTAIDENGEQTKLGRRLRFSGIQLQETTGLKLYSLNSGSQSAFNLSTLLPEPLTADSIYRDLQEFQENSQDEHLTFKIISPSGCKFVKFNDYDYGNATIESAKAAFSAGIQLSEIANIELNDIYIIKILRLQSEEVYVVMKITGLFDTDGTKNDFYEFSIKK